MEHTEKNRELDAGKEGASCIHVTVGHAGRVEGERGSAVAIEEDEAAGAVAAFGEKPHGSLCSVMCRLRV